jgi:hypothetical protein
MRVAISSPLIEERGEEITLTYPVQGLGQETLEFHIFGADRSFVPETLEPALLALLIPAMVVGSDIEVDGPVSEGLAFRVERYVVPLLARIVAPAKPISIHAAERTRNSLKGEPAVITGLSNGTDSLHVCAEHLADSAPSDLRITHFLFHDAGSHRGKELAAERLSRVRASALTMNRPLIVINANLDLFFRPLGLGYQQTHTLRSAAIAFSLSGRAKSYLYASSYPYSSVAVRETRDTASIDPVLLPLLKSETTDCFSIGASKTRVEKLAIVCETDIGKRFFDVCVNRLPNCSRCWKCARTLLSLELLGKKATVEHLFNESEFQKIRDQYIAHILVSAGRHSLNREVRELMRTTGFRPSMRQRLRAIATFPIFHAAFVPRIGPAFDRLYKTITRFSAHR